MITIIAGTNRPGSFTKKVAQLYEQLIKDSGVDVQLLSLDEHNLPERGDSFNKVQEQFLFPADKFIFVVPEYNGSYPGVTKLMIDNSNVSQAWWHKKALLTGVSSGRAGNLRGLEHLTGSLLHMKMHVHPNRLPISTIDKVMNQQGEFTDEVNLAAIKLQVEEFLKF